MAYIRKHTIASPCASRSPGPGLSSCSLDHLKHMETFPLQAIALLLRLLILGGVDIPLKGKPTAQSSTGYGGASARAIDGNTNTIWGGGSCTHTNTDNPAWWSVDLQSTTNVDSVTVLARSDFTGVSRLNGFEVKVGDSADQSKNTKCGGINSISVGQQKTVACGGKQGKFVHVVLPRSGILDFCEVKVQATAAATGR